MVTHEMRMIYVLQELNVRKDPFWSAECHSVQVEKKEGLKI